MIGTTVVQLLYLTSGQDATLTEGTYTGVRGASPRVDATEPNIYNSVDATGVVQAAITDPVLETQVGDIITIPNAEVGGTGQNITLNVDSVTAGDKTMTVARSRRSTDGNITYR